MASCLQFYGTLSLSVRVCQINLHSLVDRINALLRFTRFLGKRRLNYSRSRATGYPSGCGKSMFYVAHGCMSVKSARYLDIKLRFAIFKITYKQFLPFEINRQIENPLLEGR